MDTPNDSLKRVFAYLGLSNVEVARALHYDPSLISRYLSGKRKLEAHSPQCSAFVKLALSRCQAVGDQAWLADRLAEAGFPSTETQSANDNNTCGKEMEGTRWRPQTKT